MKTIEEKVKAYNEAIRKAKVTLGCCNSASIATKNTIYDIFPELNPELEKNEDKRIRKELKHYLDVRRCLTTDDEEYTTCNHFITWLENQGKKESDPRYKCLEDLLTADDIHQMSMNEAMVEEAKSKAVNALSKLGISKLLGLEKQDKQKPHEWHSEDEQNLNAVLGFIEDEYLRRWLKDVIHAKYEQCVDDNMKEQKVEPKFKVGNWYQCIKDFFGKGVTFDKNTAYYCAQEGCLLDGCHIAIVKDLYDNFKLWTIQDAKDGDVLANDHHILILKELVYDWSSNGTSYSVKAYCGIKPNGNFEIGKDNWCFCGTLHVHPATKEQRDLLFCKMKEAGYEWSVEEKNLLKI